MKILKLRFKNLNSLYGEWEIDLTSPEYVSNGIFALTGPTGAGKSTILDAICLALYGSTPRLGKITKSSNEIMSRQTGECSAEVLFESQAGCYLCQWKHHRGRKKADGNLQDPEHQISEYPSEKIIETKKSRVTAVIEEKTGMDFDRFKRSMLLAQGGFDTFLKADVETKSKVLEQLTGTEIYSKISQHAHERRRDEQKKLELLQDDASRIQVVEPEQLQHMQIEYESNKKQEAKLNTNSQQTDTAIRWLEDIQKIKNELKQSTQALLNLQTQIVEFKPQHEKLLQAEKAAYFDAKFATLEATRQQQQLTDEKELGEVQSKLPSFEKSAAEHLQKLTSAENITKSAKAQLQEAQPQINAVRALDQTLTEQAKATTQLSKDCDELLEKIEVNQTISSKTLGKKSNIEEKLTAINKYLSSNKQDEWLVSGLAGLEEQFSNLLEKQEEITTKERALQTAHESLKQAIKNLESKKEE
ncbi:AAA family ATPase [Halodesulfovibrio aestuarii]|uniref:AAA family ATPase n=1 Tax=Halodesulfovibrio aestuarii TaxID=126333 RepID=UPI0003FD5435